MNGVKPKTIRCAIYTRKSTEHNLDLEFNSLHAQREACEAYIKSQMHEGWQLIPDSYDDGGISGGLPGPAGPSSASWAISRPAGWTMWWSTRWTG